MGSLAGKVAIVTGAGRMRGIGRAVALRLAEDGAAVAVTAMVRRQESFPGHLERPHTTSPNLETPSF